MKKKVLLSAITLMTIFLAQEANATIWRVNNKSNYNGSTTWGDNFGGTAAFPVFTQINQAVAFGIVANADTIHVEGSTVVYEAATITKKLVIIGTGYFLTDNPATSNNTLQANIRRVSFDAGSSNSQLIGCNVINAGSSSDAYVYVNVDGVTVKRCRIERGIAFATLLSDVFILQNFFPNTYVTNALFTNGSSSFVPPTDIVFNNNICQKTLVWADNSPLTLWPILQCNNNIFDGPDNLATSNLTFSTSEFRNNILMPTNATVNIAASAGVVSYNIGTLSTQFGTANNNLVVPGIASIFSSSTSPDGAYQILAGSVASNSGSDGTDRGVFGGTALTSRYTLSGLAAIPVIYEIITPGVAGANGISVTIKARTIK